MSLSFARDARSRGTRVALGEIMRDPFTRVAARGGAARRISVATWAALAGCGVGQLPVDTGSPADLARAKFAHDAWPALANCVGCHGTQPAIDFLAPGDAGGAYDTILSFQPPVLAIASPASSLLVTMGPHTGPALTPDQTTALLGWLNAEHAARVGGDAPIRVGPVAVWLGQANAIDLGVGGAQLRFSPTALDGGLYLSDLAIAAGTGAVHVAHPLFASQPANGPAVVDGADQFADVDLDVPAGTVAPLGAGTAALWTFPPTDWLVIGFTTLEAP